MTHIFLDNDGVLAAFDEHVLSLCGELPRKLGDTKLWELVGDTPSFWQDIPVREGAYELFELALPHSPSILTGCPASGYDIAAAHKVEWIAEHFGAKYGIEIPVITCRSKDKQLHMKTPGDILVDDFYVNIKRWRAAGGKGIWYQDPLTARTELTEKIAAFRPAYE